jgi:hypothetical protein
VSLISLQSDVADCSWSGKNIFCRRYPSILQPSPSLDQTKSRKIAADLSARAGPDCEPEREIRQAKSKLPEYGRVAWPLEGSLEWVATQSLED